MDKIKYSEPCYSMAVIPTAKGDESKISQAIARLLEEDPSLSFTNNVETHQQVLSGLGEQHLDVVVAKMKTKFGVSVALDPPIVAYRETILKKFEYKVDIKSNLVATVNTAMYGLNLSHVIVTD